MSIILTLRVMPGNDSKKMPTSLFSTETQDILDKAAKMEGQRDGPFPSPADWRDQSIYFIIVDRFNNLASPPVHQPFDDPGFFDFQGGKFSGIRNQLGYIKALGAGAVWLSPVLKNLHFDRGSYHGYGIHDFLRAQPRFSDDQNAADDELRALVDAAHAIGLYVIFDIVLNHTGDVFAYNGQAQTGFHDTAQVVQWRDAAGIPQSRFTDIAAIPNPSIDALVWPVEFQRNRFFRRQGGTSRADDTIGDFATLKQMLTADRDLQSFLIRAYQYVIARYDIDGFRIDTLRYLKGDLPRVFGNAIREFALSIGKKNFFTYGEVLDGRAEEDIARFIGRSTNDQSELVGVDAALDYPLFNTLKPVVKGLAAPSVLVDMYHRRKLIEKDILSSHGDATRFFVTFLDNHDVQERIRFVQPGDEHRFDDQLTLGLAVLYCMPGIPCLYYGTEQGLHGRGSDPAVREALWGIAPLFPQNSFFYQEIQKITTVRHSEPALRYGRFYFRPVSGDGQTFGVSPFPGGVLAISRILNDQEVILVANTSANRRQSVDVILEILLSQENTNYRVLYCNQNSPEVPSLVRKTGAVTVHEVDGSIGNGPLHVIHVTLRPLEVQILRH
jgi:glycosidase